MRLGQYNLLDYSIYLYFDMDSKSIRIDIFERYPELVIKIRNQFWMLDHQGVGIQGGEDQIDDIFEKIKTIFFEPHLGNESIAEIIRSQPLLFFTKSIYSVITQYEQNLDTVYKQSKQEASQYKLQISVLKQQMSEYITLTQSLKDEINQLELQKTNTLLKLDQSENNLGLTQNKQQIQEMQRKKIEQERVNAISYSCKLEKEINQLQRQICQFQKRETINLQFKELYLQSKQQYEDLYNLHHQALNKIIQLQQDLQSLKIKYHEKSQLYQRYVQEHNYKQRHPVYQYSSPALSRETFNQQRMRGHLQKSNQLNGLVFNLTDSEQMTSKTSQLSLGDNLNIIDYESIPYQLSKSPSCGDNRVVIEKHSSNINSGKKSMKVEQNTSKKYEINMTKEKSFKKNQMFSQSKPQYSNTKKGNKISPFNPSGAKKINNLAKNNNSPNTKEYIDNILKEKLEEKNLHIQKLQAQLQAIRDLCLSHKQNLTMMQGEYQLKLQELKDMLAYTKKQLRILFQKYCSNKALCECYKQKIDELEEQIQNLKWQFRQYSSLLQNRCKWYILLKLASIEREYEEMVEWMNQHKSKLQQIKEAEVIKEVEIIREDKSQNILIYEEQTQDYDSAQKVKSDSDVFSLDFQKMKKKRQNNSSSEMFICDNLEVQSELNFKMQNNNLKGHFTQRVLTTVSTFPQNYEREKFIRRKEHLTMNHNLIQQLYVPNKPKEWTICNSQHISIQPKSLKLQSKSWEFNTSSCDRKSQKLKICRLEKISLNKKLMNLSSQQIKIKFEPQIRPKYLQKYITTFSILCLYPRQKQLQIISVNIYQYAPKQPIFSITNVFDHTFRSFKRKSKLATQLQEIITIPAHHRLMIDKCIETDTIYHQASSNQASPELSSLVSNVKKLQKISNQPIKQFSLDNVQNKNIQSENIEQYQKSILIQEVEENIRLQVGIKSTNENIIQKQQQLKQIESHTQTQVQSNKQQQKSIFVSNLIQEAKNSPNQKNQKMQPIEHVVHCQDKSSDEQSDIEIIKMLSKQTVQQTIKPGRYNCERKVQSPKEQQENIDPNINTNCISSKESRIKIEVQTIVMTKQNESTIEANQKQGNSCFVEKEIQNINSSAIATQNQTVQQKQIVKQTLNYECDEIVAQLLAPQQIKLILKYLPEIRIRFALKTRYVSIEDFFNQKRGYDSIFYYLFLTRQQKTKTFQKILISHKYMIELSSKQHLVLKDRTKFFDQRNFIFGSSEVYFFKKGVLGVNRKGKADVLKGNIPDKTYRVEMIFGLNVNIAE